MRKTLKEFYLDYVNNYLTIEKIAEHNEISYLTAKTLIAFGKYYHEKDIPHKKAKHARLLNAAIDSGKLEIIHIT